MTLRPASPHAVRAAPVSRAAGWIVAFVCAVMTVRLARFIDQYAVNVPFLDQWDFLQGLFEGADMWTLFRWQHGPQRQGLGNVIGAVVYNATGWNGRADAAASAGVMLLAALAGLCLVRRVCGPLRSWDVVVPLLFLTIASVETYIATPNLAHGPLPALFLIMYGLALTVRTHAVRCALIVSVNFCAVNTGFTLLLGGMTPPLLLLFACLPGLTGRERAIYGSGIVASLGTLMLFFRGFAFVPAATCFAFPHSRPWEYLPFFGFIVARPFGLLPGSTPTRLALASTVALGMTGLGAYATIRLLRLRGDSVLWSVTAALLGFEVLFASTTAVGRVCLGMEWAGGSRYIPYVVPGVAAVYLIVRSGLPTPRVSAALLALFLAACVLKEAATTAYTEATVYATVKQRWRDCYLKRHDIAACDTQAGYFLYPWPEATHLQQKLDWLEARRYSLFQRDAAPGAR